MVEQFRVLGYTPDDARLRADRHTNSVLIATYFPSRQDLERRREELRFNLRMAAGLYPWPEKTPLNARYEPVGEYEGYSVQKVMFESFPGFWSTGNLYLPRPMPEKAPAILNVIGHWDKQRLTRESRADYPQQLANFARMGFICLVTDMIGMVDSLQISHGYGRGEKELWQSNGLGVQLWNNIRALDLLCSMPEVDEKNIGVTGASGGGSQTLFLSLADDRVKAAAPINMISFHMQGGCACENAPGLRRCTDNVEMCAVLAPRPLFLAGSTGDWTKYLETAELPAVLDAYRQYDAENMVEHFYQDAEHQYNEKTRHRVYSFFARHLMGRDPGWVEQSIETGDLLDLTWFRGAGHAPGFENDEEFFDFHKAERRAAVAKLASDEKRKMLAWITGVKKTGFRLVSVSMEERGDVRIEKSLVCGEDGQRLPLVRLIPAGWDGGNVLLAFSDRGKDCLGNADIQKYLRGGYAVVSGDPFLTGEFAGAVRVVSGTEDDNRFFSTFHYSDDAFRIQDAALLMSVAKSMGDRLTVWADGTVSGAAACALALSEDVSWARLNEKMEELPVTGIQLLGGVKGCLELIRCPVELK